MIRTASTRSNSGALSLPFSWNRISRSTASTGTASPAPSAFRWKRSCIKSTPASRRRRRRNETPSAQIHLRLALRVGGKRTGRLRVPELAVLGGAGALSGWIPAVCPRSLLLARRSLFVSAGDGDAAARVCHHRLALLGDDAVRAAARGESAASVRHVPARVPVSRPDHGVALCAAPRRRRGFRRAHRRVPLSPARQAAFVHSVLDP